MYRYGKLKRGLLKFSDLIRDPRNPFRLIDQWVNSPKKPEVELDPDMEVEVSLTVDVEHDFGIPSTLGRLSTVEEGVRNLTEAFDKKGIEGTFFVSNPVVDNFPDLVGKISEEHEIGVHGYEHECWSEPKWWISEDRILDREGKVKRAKEMREKVEEITEETPKSFRAPYMAADGETLEVLDEVGFYYDSSAPSYYGVFPRFSRPDELSILEIPITADPQPQYEFLPFPHAKFNWLNTKLLTLLGAREMVELVTKVLKYQKQRGVKPHVVMLMHQWEFDDPSKAPEERFGYSTEDNRELIEKFVENLRERFDVEFLPMEELNLV